MYRNLYLEFYIEFTEDHNIHQGYEILFIP